jgi:hypothetical protein
MKSKKDSSIKMQVVSCYNALKGLVELYLRFNVLFAIEENDKA